MRGISDRKSSDARVVRNLRPGSIRVLLILSGVISLSLFVNYTVTMALIDASISHTETIPMSETVLVVDEVAQRDTGEGKHSSLREQVRPAFSFDTVVPAGYEGKTVDILSVASNKRPEYVKTQRSTWAAHPLVRNFFNVTEDIDGDVVGGKSCQSLSLKRVLQVPTWCRNRYLSQDSTDPDFSWVMQRFIHYYARKAWLQSKPNPAGWLCAQKRFPIGVARVVMSYAERGESLPDYLVVVDDDTYYNMDTYYSEIVQNRDSSDPFVGAGCRVTNGQNKESGIVFPFGGFGLTFSKGSIQRLLQPLSKSNAMTNDEWQNSTLATIDQNLIVEGETFRDGMNLAEMMEKFALAEPFQNVSRWTRGYCFHGHWMLAIFTQLYELHSEVYMDAIQDSQIKLKSSKKGPRYTNLCKNEYLHCKPSDLACHYQTPHDMERLASGAAKRKNSGYNISKMTLSLVNMDAKPPMIVLKSRFMQFQPNLLALGRARLQLFETFCLPTILGQQDKDFLWLIRIDPDLAVELLSPLKKMIEPYSDRFFLIASNDNTEGFRKLNVDSLKILSGDREVLREAVTRSNEHWLVESRLDADDGLQEDMIGTIREKATEYARTNANSTSIEWRAFCVGRSIYWHSGALAPLGEVDPNVTNTLNIPAEGILTQTKKQHKTCITPGLSYVLPPSVSSPPAIGHHVLHENVPPCDGSHDFSGQKCLKFLDLDFQQAIQARTPTSHGMGGFQKEYSPKKDVSKLWDIVESKFNISPSKAKSVIEDFKENIIDIAKDNLAGQCTEDHSCSHFARRYLERIIWNKYREMNETITSTS